MPFSCRTVVPPFPSQARRHGGHRCESRNTWMCPWNPCAIWRPLRTCLYAGPPQVLACRCISPRPSDQLQALHINYLPGAIAPHPNIVFLLLYRNVAGCTRRRVTPSLPSQSLSRTRWRTDEHSRFGLQHPPGELPRSPTGHSHTHTTIGLTPPGKPHRHSSCPRGSAIRSHKPAGNAGSSPSTSSKHTSSEPLSENSSSKSSTIVL